jgi:hypothetical protein
MSETQALYGEQPDGTFVVEKILSEIQPPKKRRLSISQLELLSKCGYAYELRYIKKMQEPKGISLFVGSAIHASVAANLNHKIEKGSLLPLDKVIECGVMNFTREISKPSDENNILFKQDELLDGKAQSIQAGRDKVKRLSRLHAESVAPNLEPMFVERPIGIVLDGYPFDVNGVIDIEEPEALRDTKTKNKTPSKDVAEVDDQLTQYGMLKYLSGEGIPKSLVLDCLIDNKTPIYKPFATTRVEEDFQVLLYRIENACLVIERGAFVPARESDWWCGKEACGFWEKCKYVKRSKRPTS